MNFSTTRTVALLLLAASALLAGCQLQSPEASSVPWNSPASWEGQVPGMGVTPGSNLH